MTTACLWLVGRLECVDTSAEAGAAWGFGGHMCNDEQERQDGVIHRVVSGALIEERRLALLVLTSVHKAHLQFLFFLRDIRPLANRRRTLTALQHRLAYIVCIVYSSSNARCRAHQAGFKLLREAFMVPATCAASDPPTSLMKLGTDMSSRISSTCLDVMHHYFDQAHE